MNIYNDIDNLVMKMNVKKKIYRYKLLWIS